MSKWLEPSGYFGPYFGAEGEAVLTASAFIAVSCSGSLTALEAETSGAGANTYTLAPKTREQWEAEREAARVQDSEVFTEREQAPQAEQTPKRVREPRIPLPLLFQEPKQPTTLPVEAPAAVARLAPPVQVVADFPVSDEELAAIALVLTARANAYRRVNTGNPQPLVAA